MPIRFVAYIDEAGDTGIDGVRPVDPSGATEWLLLSCMVVRESDDQSCMEWVKEIKSKFTNVNSPFLHYKDLLPKKKEIACNLLVQKPCRFFVVASNKRNIDGWKNEAAEFVSGKGSAWLYWWLARLLLERVTSFCEARVPIAQRGQAKILFVFSRRGGLKYVDFCNYLKRLHKQSRTNSLHIKKRDLCWSVVDEDELLVLDSSARAGLQLSDLCAGAFFQALENKSNFDTQFAKSFKPRMAFGKGGTILGEGLKTMPELHQMGLTLEQREIFEFYGYSPRGW